MAKLVDTVVSLLKGLRDDLTVRIDALEQRAAVPGRDGRDGAAGVMGPQGEKGMSGERGERGEAGPTGPQGEPGPQGERGPAGEAGISGKDGAPGEMGPMGLSGADGARGERGEKGDPGLHGKDGADGITMAFEEFVGVEYDGEKTFTWVFRQGEREKRCPIRCPVPIYRDVYVDGKQYDAGDSVTWGGSLWIAKAETTTKPGSGPEAAKAWRMSVKSGRDGKPGPAGPEGPAGPRGPQGERGPQRW